MSKFFILAHTNLSFANCLRKIESFFHFFVYVQEHNADYFSQYVTENFEEYVSRKRLVQVHGNHLEIQALSELYNRPIHIYCYSPGIYDVHL